MLLNESWSCQNFTGIAHPFWTCNVLLKDFLLTPNLTIKKPTIFSAIGKNLYFCTLFKWQCVFIIYRSLLKCFPIICFLKNRFVSTMLWIISGIHALYDMVVLCLYLYFIQFGDWLSLKRFWVVYYTDKEKKNQTIKNMPVQRN